MASAKEKSPRAPCEAPSKGHHVCECYGHTSELPEYRKLAVPRTLQGFHAREGGGCSCIPKTKPKQAGAVYCSTNPMTRDRVMPTETYRAHDPGEHKVHPAEEVPVESSAVRDPVTGRRLVFPNARNYGGTATQRRFPATGEPRRKTREEREYEQMQDRKEFLKAVLRDEMRDHHSAEAQLEELENQLGLRGSRHAQLLNAAAAREAENRAGDDDAKTVGEQYEEVMEELRYVTRQPVGSKVNLIRMYYLLEEQDRLKYLRDQGKKAGDPLHCNAPVR
ncbi:hypothetical protein TraAM80_08843 [Trypanosoma rangeli]|uniref:Uncharacterized protein n=1 Tax=Trypanosoma rangeli TaxID=5698 RepID=A0A422MYM9_TRYRA|nr:uncharacterized protein TraAM80_08843 [Trypanosoma rangeli]RNE98313.1 hypothetical protein TraAM80_08843 [Trypanosoma rangeli]|eukprot:RNE98313.1 hypothetical protein TraAM80_08843 [Trypanosoma rangeli]